MEKVFLNEFDVFLIAFDILVNWCFGHLMNIDRIAESGVHLLVLQMVVFELLEMNLLHLPKEEQVVIIDNAR